MQAAMQAADLHGIPKAGQPRSTVLLGSLCETWPPMTGPAPNAGSSNGAAAGGLDSNHNVPSIRPMSPVPQSELPPHRQMYASNATMRMLQLWPNHRYAHAGAGPASMSASDHHVDEAAAVKPPFSFPCLIGLALGSCSTGRMSVREIYDFIESKFPFFKTAKAGWKNSVRHNLSLSKMFCKLNRQETEKGNYKGKFLWGISETWRDQIFSDIQKYRDGQIKPPHHRLSSDLPTTPLKTTARGPFIANGRARSHPYKKQEPPRPGFKHQRAARSTVKLSQRQRNLRQRQVEAEQKQALAAQARAAKEAQDDRDFFQQRAMQAARLAEERGDGAYDRKPAVVAIPAHAYAHYEAFDRETPSPLVATLRHPQPGPGNDSPVYHQSSQVVDLLSDVDISVDEIDELIEMHGEQRRFRQGQAPAWDNAAAFRLTPLLGEQYIQQEFGVSLAGHSTDIGLLDMDMQHHSDGGNNGGLVQRAC